MYVLNLLSGLTAQAEEDKYVTFEYTLICRRLITVVAKVREIYPQKYQSALLLPDYPIGFVSSMKPSYWKREPAVVQWGMNGIEEITDYNPPPLGMDQEELQRLFQAL